MKVILKPHEIWSKFNLPIGTVIETEGDMNTGSEGEDGFMGQACMSNIYVGSCGCELPKYRYGI